MFVYNLVVVVVNERQLNLSSIVDGPTIPLSASPKLWVSIFQFIIINCSSKIIILYHLKKRLLLVKDYVKPFCPLCECKPLFPISRVDRDISPSPPQLPQGENQMQLLCESRLNKYTNVQKTNTSILGHGDMILVKNTCITFFGVCNHRDQWAR